MTTIVKTINPANKTVEQINVNGTAAPINVAPGAIVEVQAGRAQVASFIQNGKNLVLVMIDGTEIVLQGYFDHVEGTAKKLILVDENGPVEVQFPAAEGSAADGASVDVAPSYVTTDADTNTLLADSAAAATESGISPVLLGVLGAIGVGALAAGGGGGGGDSAAPAAKTEQQIDSGKEEVKEEVKEEGKEEGKEEVNEGIQSPADLVAQIKMLSAVILISKDDARADTSDLLNLQEELLGLRPAVAAKIAELEQSDTADDQQIKEELQVLGGMLDRFSSGLDKERDLGEPMDEYRSQLDKKEHTLDKLQSSLEKFEKANGDLESEFAEQKASLKEKIEAIEDGDLKENLSALIESAKGDVDSVIALQNAIDSALKVAGPFAGSEEISDDIGMLEAIANDIEKHEELVEGVHLARHDLNVVLQQYE
ncbi:MAG: hypothetical protein JWQ79_4104, partial [Mucilaginibacter sp.]|nr:hypothetical protein [Mucilaginibacter sp.]